MLKTREDLKQHLKEDYSKRFSGGDCPKTKMNVHRN